MKLSLPIPQWPILLGMFVVFTGGEWILSVTVQPAMADRFDNIRTKGEQVKRGVEKWAKEGRNPSEIVALAKRVPGLMQRGKVNEAEALLDRALELLAIQRGALKGLRRARYEKLVVRGEKARGGIYDPSVKYTADGSVGWLAYSAIDGPHRIAGPYIHTRLARSTNAGRSWTQVKTINVSVDATLSYHDGKRLRGVWRYEVSTLIHDPTDGGKEWKLFAHRYFWTEQLDRMPAYGWIAYRHSSDPAGKWSNEVPLFGAGRFPPAPYHRTRTDLNTLHPDLRGSVAYSEPGALVHNGVLYMSMTRLVLTGPDFVFLIASYDHGNNWKYVGRLLDKRDAAKLGDNLFDGSSLASAGGKVLLLVSPERGGFMHFGTYVFEFDDVTRGKLKRDRNGKPIVVKHILPQAAFLSGRGAGQSTYDPHNTYGGVIIPQVNVSAHPEVFQIFNTREFLLPLENAQ